MEKYWIIGSSSGIGRELAKKLDAKGYDLILSSTELFVFLSPLSTNIKVLEF